MGEGDTNRPRYQAHHSPIQGARDLANRKGGGVMSHTLEECEHASSEYLDSCPVCGDLTACVCLASIVSEWEIAATGQGGAFAYRYQFTPQDSPVARFGYAESYREAMDSIAHSVNCEGGR